MDPLQTGVVLLGAFYAATLILGSGGDTKRKKHLVDDDKSHGIIASNSLMRVKRQEGYNLNEGPSAVIQARFSPADPTAQAHDTLDSIFQENAEIENEKLRWWHDYGDKVHAPLITTGVMSRRPPLGLALPGSDLPGIYNME